MKTFILFFRKSSLAMHAEFRRITCDAGALLILAGAILVYTLVYSAAYQNEVVRNIPIALADLDQTASSRQYGRLLDATENLEVDFKSASLAEARDLFDSGKVRGIVEIPEGFEKKLLQGEQTSVSFYCDAGYFLLYKQVYSGAAYATQYWNAGLKLRREQLQGKNSVQASASAEPLLLKTTNLFNPSGGYGSFVLPGIILVILQQTMLIGISLPGHSGGNPGFHAGAEVIGKALVYTLLGLFTSTYGLLWVYNWFDFPDKSGFLKVFLILIPFLLSTSLLGIALSGLFREREDSIIFLVFLSPLVLFLSGFSWPAQSMPYLLDLAGHLFPSRFAVPSYIRMRSMGAGPAEILPEVTGLWIQAGLYYMLAWYALKRQQRKPKEQGRLQFS